MNTNTVEQHRLSPVSPLLLLAYPAILALGSLYSKISPTTTGAKPKALVPGLSSDISTPVESSPINYFASKRNVLNVYFVKVGWAWTTLAFLLILLTQHSRALNRRFSRSKTLAQSVLRYTLATITWIATTQWFFGPPWTDRSFTISGGRCEPLPERAQEAISYKVERLMTEYTCKRGGGIWTGGHDISGHVFMLTLSSAFLMLEIYISDLHSSISPKAAASIAAETSQDEKREIGGWESLSLAEVRLWARRFVFVVVALDWWMIFMTAIFFHTLPEKVSGLLIATTAIYAIYFLPQFVQRWRDLIGGLHG